MKQLVVMIASCVALSLTLPSCVSKKRYNRAKSSLQMARADSARLASQLNELSNQSMAQQSRLKQLQATNQLSAAELNMSQEELTKQRDRLRQLQTLIDQQNRKTEMLRQKVAEALQAFNTSQLTVSMKDGKVYVSLQESLLFPSGSATLNSGGKTALSQLASVLNQNPDINVDVEGHTDSVAIGNANKKFRDNWDLSVARSTEIARIMIDEYRVSPNRITASGRSKYDPIESNSTVEGRAHNRRTEIILEPKLDELMDIISSR